MTAMSDDDDDDDDVDNVGYNEMGDSDGGGCPRLFQLTARFDRVMGDVAYDQRHQNRARG